MPKPEYEFFDTDTISWEPIEGTEGLYQKIISKDDNSGDYTRLLLWDPGADSSPMGTQVHDFWEEVYIIRGSIHDLVLDETFSAGMYACRPPGMRHGPWRSEDGSLMLEIRYYKG